MNTIRKKIISICFVLILLFTVSVTTCLATDIKINEVLVHPGSGSHEWVELYNPDKIDISNYWIDDDSDFVNDNGNSTKKSLKEIQATDTQHPYIELTTSMFNNSGDSVVLFDSNGIIVDQYAYTKDPGDNIAIGRTPDGSGDFTVLTTATKGLANAQEQPSPTLSPTKVPTPTHTPVPTKTPSPTPTMKILSPTPTYLPKNSIVSSSGNSFTLADKQEAFPTQKAIPSVDSTESLSATASSEDAVLGANISVTVTPTQKRKILVKAAETSSFIFLPIILSLAGGACLIACGILIFLKIRKISSPQGEET